MYYRIKMKISCYLANIQANGCVKIKKLSKIVIYMK